MFVDFFFLQDVSDILFSTFFIIYFISGSFKCIRHKITENQRSFSSVIKGRSIYFWKFWQYITHRLYCNQHATLKKCIFFYTLTSKAQGMCEGASKQSQNFKNYTTPGPRPRFINSWIRHWLSRFCVENWVQPLSSAHAYHVLNNNNSTSLSQNI